MASKPRARVKARPTGKSKVKKTVRLKAKKTASKRVPVKVAKKAAKRSSKEIAAIPRPGIIPPVNGILLGFVEDYFVKVGVIALTLKGPVAVGQRIQVLGHTTHLEEIIDSMQIEHVAVRQAGAKVGVGIKVIGRARVGDHVYLLK